MHRGWIAIFRLGLVQMALGAVVVLTTSTLNRLMIVELALPAVLPGALVAFHYGIQISRPRWGFLSDVRGRRTLWIILGMIALAIGALGAAAGVVLFETWHAGAMVVSILSYALIGLGVAASGTSLLTLLAAVAEPERRAAAATITWLMMIAGIALTAAMAGAFLDPYSHTRLLNVVAVVAIGSVVASVAAVYGIEMRLCHVPPTERQTQFLAGLAEVWTEPRARNFTFFVFLSMTAFFMQELILEPYAGLVFGYTPGQSTALSGAQNGGVFLGMLSVGIAATGLRIGNLRVWVVAGCLGSAASLASIVVLGGLATPRALVPAVVCLGMFNGMFAVAAIASMMALAGEGRQAREGTRMGLWGAAQALAAGFGGLLGAAAVDIGRGLTNDPAAFGTVFLAEAMLFALTALMAVRVIKVSPMPARRLVAGE